jgi:transposase
VTAQRFTPEFKEEAVRQVVERGYGVPDVAARLGVAAHSLDKWVKAVSPDLNYPALGLTKMRQVCERLHT